VTSIARKPLETPATWRGPDLLESDDWIHRLTPAEMEQGIPTKEGAASDAADIRAFDARAAG